MSVSGVRSRRTCAPARRVEPRRGCRSARAPSAYSRRCSGCVVSPPASPARRRRPSRSARSSRRSEWQQACLRFGSRRGRLGSRPPRRSVIPHDQGFQDVAQVAPRLAAEQRAVTSSLAVVTVHRLRPAHHNRPVSEPSTANGASSRGPSREHAHDTDAAVTSDHSGPGPGGDDPVQAPAPPPTASTQPVASSPVAQEPVEGRDGGHDSESSGPGSGVLAVEPPSDGASSHDGSGHDGSGRDGGSGSSAVGSGGSGSSGGGDDSVADLTTDSH